MSKTLSSFSNKRVKKYVLFEWRKMTIKPPEKCKGIEWRLRWRCLCFTILTIKQTNLGWIVKAIRCLRLLHSLTQPYRASWNKELPQGFSISTGLSRSSRLSSNTDGALYRLSCAILFSVSLSSVFLVVSSTQSISSWQWENFWPSRCIEKWWLFDRVCEWEWEWGHKRSNWRKWMVNTCKLVQLVSVYLMFLPFVFHV